MSKPKYRTGQVVMIDLGDMNTRQIRGHEQAKVRPSLILKADNKLKLLVIIPFTSKTPKNDDFRLVKVEKDMKLFTMDSYALCHQIRTVSNERATKALGMLNPRIFEKIKFVVADYLDL